MKHRSWQRNENHVYICYSACIVVVVIADVTTTTTATTTTTTTITTTTTTITTSTITTTTTTTTATTTATTTTTTTTITTTSAAITGYKAFVYEVGSSVLTIDYEVYIFLMAVWLGLGALPATNLFQASLRCAEERSYSTPGRFRVVYIKHFIPYKTLYTIYSALMRHCQVTLAFIFLL